MPPRPFVNDALWRCLCPRWSQVPVRAELSTIGARSRKTALSIPSCAPRQLQRSYNAAAAAAPSVPFTPGETTQIIRGGPSQIKPSANPRDVFQGPAFTKASKKDFVYMTTEELYHEARVRAGKGRHLEVLKILEILIKDRGERPNLAMYTALLHSYTSAPWGTAGKIRKALEDMEIAGVEPDARACECALEALAVHPDSFLRTDILEYMKERWWTLSPRAEGFVVAGLLRERCFEQAMERLEGMKDNARVDGWVWDKAIWILLEFGEVEEAFHVLNLKQSVNPNVDTLLSDTLWLRLLDVAAHKHMNDAANMIWYNRVFPGYLKPSTGTCFNVLSSASRVGDVKLATDVFRVLAERNTVFSSHHYEAILQCYLGVRDMNAALQIILIMQESSLSISEAQLHPLYAYLCRDPTRPMNTFMHLQDLARSGRKIPTAAVNTCIRAAVTLNNLTEAIELYKALSSVCPAGPTTATFNELFRGCNLQVRKELAMYLASEMIDLDISPDRTTYDRLVLTCCRAGDLDDAIGYYEEMTAEKMLLRRGTHETLIVAALDKGDARCVALLKAYKEAEYCVDSRAAVLERRVGRMWEERLGEEEESMEDMLGALQEGGESGVAKGPGKSEKGTGKR